MSTVNQNWDGVTAPAIPAGWSVTSGVITDSAPVGVSPTSSPNILRCPGTVTGAAFAVFTTVDDNGGNVTVAANLDTHGPAPGATGVFCRGTGTSAPPSAYYLAQLNVGTNVRLFKTASLLATCTTSALASDAWYRLFLTTAGSSISVNLQRASDSKWLDTTGTFVTAQTACIAIIDTGIAPAVGSFGIFFNTASLANQLYSDDFTEGYAFTPLSPPVPEPAILLAGM